MVHEGSLLHHSSFSPVMVMNDSFSSVLYTCHSPVLVFGGGCSCLVRHRAIV